MKDKSKLKFGDYVRVRFPSRNGIGEISYQAQVLGWPDSTGKVIHLHSLHSGYEYNINLMYIEPIEFKKED